MQQFTFAPNILPSLNDYLGVLELLPAFMFLFIMHPKLNKNDRSYSPTPEIPRMRHSSSGALQRVDSGIRSNETERLLLVAGSGHIRRETPLIMQQKGATVYGTASVAANEPVAKI
jgi:hypothetical protein